MSNEQLIYEIAGKRYILIEVPFVEGHVEKMKKFCDKYDMVFQGIKTIDRGGWFSKGVVVNKLLLPEERFEAYSKDKSSL